MRLLFYAMLLSFLTVASALAADQRVVIYDNVETKVAPPPATLVAAIFQPARGCFV